MQHDAAAKHIRTAVSAESGTFAALFRLILSVSCVTSPPHFPVSCDLFSAALGRSDVSFKHVLLVRQYLLSARRAQPSSLSAGFVIPEAAAFGFYFSFFFT